MIKTLYIALLSLTLLSSGCVKNVVLPLIGEDPEVSALLKSEPAATPGSSPLAAGRRLHQALIQGDVDLAWALLSPSTRDILNAKGAAIGVAGRELIESSSLPSASGKVERVRFDEVLFGGPITAMSQAESPASKSGRAVLIMTTSKGKTLERTFILDAGDWKLELAKL